MSLKKGNIPPADIDWNQFMPGISIDCVIFGYNDKELKVLILEYKKTGLFALPGGFRRNAKFYGEPAGCFDDWDVPPGKGSRSTRVRGSDAG